jgi:sec-independent protein translocase protein TatA
MGLDNPLHIAIILIVVLLVFGAKRLPELGKSMGEGLRGFKESVSTDNHGQPSQVEASLPSDPRPVDQPEAPVAQLSHVAAAAERTPVRPAA